MSEEIFNIGDLKDAKIFENDLQNEDIEGVCLIEGENVIVWGPSAMEKLFLIRYRSHSTYVEGLQKGETYYYAVGGEGEYKFGEFIVGADEETVIVNFNDFQTNDGEKLSFGSRTLKATRKVTNIPVDFFAFGGDFTSAFQLDAKKFNHYLGWVRSREELEPYIQDTPMIMAAGNHDAMGQLFVANHMVDYAQIMDDGGCYSFDYNNVRFIVLNTNDFNETQYEWFKKMLAEERLSKGIEWTIVMLHVGPYTTGDHGLEIDEEYVKQISGLCSSYEVDLVLQAHDHTYSKTLPYLWGTAGYTTSENDESVINLSVETIVEEGIECDFNPKGTYYVSCGAAGHRIGENADYAQSFGNKSYTNRKYKVAISQISVDSEYGRLGEKASADLGHDMFGVLHIAGKRLVYDFYVVEGNGNAVFYDRLAIKK